MKMFATGDMSDASGLRKDTWSIFHNRYRTGFRLDSEIPAIFFLSVFDNHSTVMWPFRDRNIFMLPGDKNDINHEVLTE